MKLFPPKAELFSAYFSDAPQGGRPEPEAALSALHAEYSLQELLAPVEAYFLAWHHKEALFKETVQGSIFGVSPQAVIATYEALGHLQAKKLPALIEKFTKDRPPEKLTSEEEVSWRELAAFNPESHLYLTPKPLLSLQVSWLKNLLRGLTQVEVFTEDSPQLPAWQGFFKAGAVLSKSYRTGYLLESLEALEAWHAWEDQGWTLALVVQAFLLAQGGKPTRNERAQEDLFKRRLDQWSQEHHRAQASKWKTYKA